ncbi:MAG: rRNA pseudouridine synthase, partial [Alphaproteobacteria bacterium]|nr:rRNA pseudouridine synthase [Alphaproteobacteria bacterium]
MTRVRLAKFIADSGVASRRGAEDLITSGVVSVNGAVVTTPVFFVDNGDTVTVRGRRVVPQDDTRLYVFHKPINVMTTAHDPSGRRTIYDVLPR